MLLALCEEEPVLLITVKLLVLALSMLDVIEVNMPKLSVAAGRNELNIPMQRVFEILRDAGGWMPEKTFDKIMGRELQMMELIQVKRYLVSTEEIYIEDVDFPIEGKVVRKKMVMTADKYKEKKK